VWIVAKIDVKSLLIFDAFLDGFLLFNGLFRRFNGFEREVLLVSYIGLISGELMRPRNI